MGISVLIDAEPLRHFGKSITGFGRYIRALIETIPDQEGIELSALSSRPIDSPASVRLVAIRRRMPGRLTFPEHVFRLSLDIANARPDVFHSATNEPPMVCTRPWVQTLHDITPLLSHNPGFRWERNLWRLRAFAMRRADRVICISRYAADCGIRYLRIRPDRIRVIHHGVDPIFTPAVGSPEEDPPYLLYVGSSQLNKGYSEAFAVIERLAGLGFPHRLRMVGPVHDWARSSVDGLLAGTTRVDMTGTVSDAELAELYRGATALIVTSRAEGFGFPAIEAMASGTPIVSFDNTSLPEVIGDGGLLVADGDVDAFVEATRTVIMDDRTRAELSARARARASAFSRAKSAAEHAEVYREAAEIRQ